MGISGARERQVVGEGCVREMGERVCKGHKLVNVGVILTADDILKCPPSHTISSSGMQTPNFCLSVSSHE